MITELGHLALVLAFGVALKGKNNDASLRGFDTR